VSRKRRKATPPKEPELRAERPLAPARAAAAVAAILVLAAAAFLFWRHSAAPPARAERLNLLLVTLDTTRADHLGCYGDAAARTRHLDRLAAEGVRFERAYATAPITLPSHASLLTGLYPFEHGVRNNGNFYLADRYATIATVLKGQGYRTAAFVSAFILDRRYGLARGFDTYDDRMEGAETQVVALEAERRGDRTALALARWLEANAVQPAPFFAWLHLYDPHEPYRPPPPFREAFADRPYDGEIAFDDAAVASILDKLGALGALDRTLVAVIGDHGESLGDHGEETHSMFVYEGAIRVPMILWRPGRVPAGVVVREPVRGIDLAPTLLELLGAPALKAPNARSLVPLLASRAAARTPAVYAETYLPRFYMNWAPLRALIDERYKLIDAPRPELYDLGEDPGETQNRYATQERTVAAFRAELQRITAGSEGSMNVGALDREAAEKLAALGYIGAGSEPAPPQGAVPRDPKDVIATFNRLRRANSAVRDRRFAEALPILHEVLAEDPRNAFAQLVLGSAHMGQGEYRKAIEQYRKYVELVPTSAYAHQWMAICYLNLNDRDGAMREAEAALAIDPRFSDARVLRAGVLAARGRHPEAIAELRQAVATDPAKPTIRLDLAKILAEAGRREEARAEYEAALAQQPDFAPALVGLGALQAETGALDDAARNLRRALEIDARQAEARFNLARTLERQGRPADAVTEYRRLAGDSDTPPAVRDASRKRLSALSRQ
jgi:arylsulfatase A-like enzyme/Flp pilus assembly protein TadD